MLIQYSSQFGFDVVRWTADHEALLAIAVVIVTIIPLTVSVILKKNPHLFFASIIINVNNFTIVYCNLVSYQRFPVWTFVVALIALIALAAAREC
jgi:hypothetical protein